MKFLSIASSDSLKSSELYAILYPHLFYIIPDYYLTTINTIYYPSFYLCQVCNLLWFYNRQVYLAVLSWS